LTVTVEHPPGADADRDEERRRNRESGKQLCRDAIAAGIVPVRPSEEQVLAVGRLLLHAEVSRREQR
jgi:hypothetical protein